MRNIAHFIYLIQDPVCVVRHRRSKHYDFVKLRKLLQKFITARPYHIKSFIVLLLSLLEVD